MDVLTEAVSTFEDLQSASTLKHSQDEPALVLQYVNEASRTERVRIDFTTTAPSREQDRTGT